MIKGIFTRNLEHDDLPLLWSLGKEVLSTSTAFTHRWDAEHLSRILADEDSFCIMALRRKKPVGFIAGVKATDDTGPFLKILWYGVATPLQEKGIEEMLLSAVKKEAARRRLSKISLTINPDSPEKQRLVKFNFTAEKQFVVMHLQ